MFPTSSPTLINGSLVWTYPGCPLRIRFSLRALERLRAQIPAPQKSAASVPTRQLGGLLIGRKKSRSGITDVVDFVPLLASIDPTSSQFGFVNEWLDEVADRCPPDYKIVGYYRTSADESIRLTADDLKLIQQRFADATNVFLVIAAGSQGTSAGFFCWYNGAVALNCRLTFPFSADELASGGWPIRNGGMWRERLSQLMASKVRPLRQPGLWTKGISAALVVALVFTGGVLLRRSLGARASVAASSSFALHVERTGPSFVLSWDRTAPQIASASGGSLEIHEGTKPVSLLSLTPEQLQLGTLSYGSYPYTDQAEFRLLVSGAGGAPLESKAVASPIVSTAAAEPTTAPRPTTATNLSARDNLTAPGKLSAPTNLNSPAKLRASLVQSEKPPVKADDWQEPRRPVQRPAASAPPQQAVENPEPPPAPAVPAAPPSPARAFVPPAPKAAATLAAPRDIAIPEPPPAGRIRMLGNMLSWELANTLPVNRTAPPPGEATDAETQNSFIARQAAAAESMVGLVTITSEPSGAAVQINDRFAGTTPVSLQMSPIGLGFTITVTKSGFSKWTVQSVATQQHSSLHARLRPN